MKDAQTVLGSFDDSRILWEEPCNTVPINLEVAESTGAPVIFDQCLKSLDLYAQVCSRDINASVCIKPTSPSRSTLPGAGHGVEIPVGADYETLWSSD